MTSLSQSHPPPRLCGRLPAPPLHFGPLLLPAADGDWSSGSQCHPLKVGSAGPRLQNADWMWVSTKIKHNDVLVHNCGLHTIVAFRPLHNCGCAPGSNTMMRCHTTVRTPQNKIVMCCHTTVRKKKYVTQPCVPTSIAY